MADDPNTHKRACESADEFVNLLKAAEGATNNPEMAAVTDCYVKFRDQLYELHRNSSPSETYEKKKKRLDLAFLRCEMLVEKWENLKILDLARTTVEEASNHRNPKVVAFVPKLSAMYQCRVDFRDQLNELDADTSVPPELLGEKYKKLWAVLKRCKTLEEKTAKEVEKEMKELRKWHFDIRLSW